MKNNIKQTIDSMGITQKTLAGLVGMTENGISKAINGSASEETIKKVAKALNVTVESLVDNSELYAAYSSGDTPLRIGDLKLDCYVLNNGQRVLSGRGIQKALGSSSQSGDWLKRLCSSGELSSYFDNGDNSILARVLSPLTFRRNNAGGSQTSTNAYEATLLIDICSAILDARDSGDYTDPIVIASAESIIRSVAKVGIIALVDEATGYNKVKNRAIDELQRYLDAFMMESAAKWVKTFPDEFFEDLYKMRGWTWTKIAKKPQVVGKWINDIVYERIGPMVLNELQTRNPKDKKGHRRHNHFQYLTEEIGLPKLKSHLTSLHTLAVVSRYNWAKFMGLVERVHPRQFQQLSLFEDDIDD